MYRLDAVLSIFLTLLVITAAVSPTNSPKREVSTTPKRSSSQSSIARSGHGDSQDGHPALIAGLPPSSSPETQPAVHPAPAPTVHTSQPSTPPASTYPPSNPVSSPVLHSADHPMAVDQPQAPPVHSLPPRTSTPPNFALPSPTSGRRAGDRGLSASQESSPSPARAASNSPADRTISSPPSAPVSPSVPARRNSVSPHRPASGSRDETPARSSPGRGSSSVYGTRSPSPGAANRQPSQVGAYIAAANRPGSGASSRTRDLSAHINRLLNPDRERVLGWTTVDRTVSGRNYGRPIDGSAGAARGPELRESTGARLRLEDGTSWRELQRRMMGNFQGHPYRLSYDEAEIRPLRAADAVRLRYGTAKKQTTNAVSDSGRQPSRPASPPRSASSQSTEQQTRYDQTLGRDTGSPIAEPMLRTRKRPHIGNREQALALGQIRNSNNVRGTASNRELRREDGTLRSTTWYLAGPNENGIYQILDRHPTPPSPRPTLRGANRPLGDPEDASHPSNQLPEWYVAPVIRMPRPRPVSQTNQQPGVVHTQYTYETNVQGPNQRGIELAPRGARWGTSAFPAQIWNTLSFGFEPSWHDPNPTPPPMEVSPVNRRPSPRSENFAIPGFRVGEHGEGRGEPVPYVPPTPRAGPPVIINRRFPGTGHRLGNEPGENSIPDPNASDDEEDRRGRRATRGAPSRTRKSD